MSDDELASDADHASPARTGRPRDGIAKLEMQSFQSTGGARVIAEGQLTGRFTDTTLHYARLRLEEGILQARTHVDEGVHYWGFNPPSSWGATHSVLLAHVVNARPDWYINHRGEEVLCGADGDVRIGFYYAGEKGGPPSAIDTKPLGDTGVLRINPTVPHMIWTLNPVAKDVSYVPPERPNQVDRSIGGLAWVIFRNPSAASVSVDRKLLRKREPATHLTPEHLNKPGHYGMTAWGIAPELRAAREDAQLSLSDVATYCGITTAHMSRIEAGATNVSFDALERLASLLNVDIPRVVAENAWCYSAAAIPARVGGLQPALACPPCLSRHDLHPSVWDISSDETPAAIQLALGDMGQAGSKGRPRDHFLTWIVLSGRIVVDLGTPGASNTQELLTAGSVLHLRGNTVRAVESMGGDARLLVIECAPLATCRCADPADQSTFARSGIRYCEEK